MANSYCSKPNPDEYRQVTAYEVEINGIEFQSPCWAAPIISHGLMYVRGKKQLVCFELIPAVCRLVELKRS